MMIGKKGRKGSVGRPKSRATTDLRNLESAQTFPLFPAFADNYASFLNKSARGRRAAPEAELIASLLKTDPRNLNCGFQSVQLLDSELIRQSEQWLCTGEFEPYLKAREKYEEYARRLRVEPEFRRDWQAIRAVYPREASRKGIIHRTLSPERNWVRDGGAKFETRAQRFQACFDLLCWKYCLWGVGRGRPLLLKPSVVLTPHGTQIFIPAYFSLDAKRDLNLGLITRLHRARGIVRQGEKLSSRRSGNADQLRKAKQLTWKPAS